MTATTVKFGMESAIPRRREAPRPDDVEVLKTTPATEFCSGEVEPIQYLSRPSLVRGGMTIPYGGPKVGKTTLSLHLAHGILDPVRHPFLDGTERLGGPILMLDLDQPYRVSRRRISEAGAHPDFHIYRGPPPDIAALLATIDKHNYRAILVDCLSVWLGLENENDNAEIERALRPYQQAFQSRDITSIIIDHSGKADGPTGRTLRGGSAKLAICDIAVEVKPEGPLQDGRRRLCFTSREEPQNDMIVRLVDGRFVVDGSAKARESNANNERIRQGIRLSHQRKEALAEYLEISSKTLEGWIQPLLDGGEIKAIRSQGTGRPIVYHLVQQRETSEKSLGSSQEGELL